MRHKCGQQGHRSRQRGTVVCDRVSILVTSTQYTGLKDAEEPTLLLLLVLVRWSESWKASPRGMLRLLQSNSSDTVLRRISVCGIAAGEYNRQPELCPTAKVVL